MYRLGRATIPVPTLGTRLERADTWKRWRESRPRYRRDCAAAAEKNTASVALPGDGEGGRMHTVDLYRKVRLACRKGMNERAAPATQ